MSPQAAKPKLTVREVRRVLNKEKAEAQKVLDEGAKTSSHMAHCDACRRAEIHLHFVDGLLLQFEDFS